MRSDYKNTTLQSDYIVEIKQILAQARQKAYSAVNTAMVEAYLLIGKRIVEEEQNGEDRAGYGKEILKTLSIALNTEFGKGFSLTNLQNFRKFYLLFSDGVIQQTSSAILPNQIQQTVSVESELEKGQIGQLDMYVRMFDDLKRKETDDPTIGILLCTETDSTIARYSVLSDSKQLFASKYMPFLPTEEELIAEIERGKIAIKQRLGL